MVINFSFLKHFFFFFFLLVGCKFYGFDDYFLYIWLVFVCLEVFSGLLKILVLFFLNNVHLKFFFFFLVHFIFSLFSFFYRVSFSFIFFNFGRNIFGNFFQTYSRIFLIFNFFVYTFSYHLFLVNFIRRVEVFICLFLSFNFIFELLIFDNFFFLSTKLFNCLNQIRFLSYFLVPGWKGLNFSRELFNLYIIFRGYLI